VHEIVRRNISASPLYNGQIKGIGPRYCPSLEDKVMRFPERERHHVVLEPGDVRGARDPRRVCAVRERRGDGLPRTLEDAALDRPARQFRQLELRQF